MVRSNRVSFLGIKVGGNSNWNRLLFRNARLNYCAGCAGVSAGAAGVSVQVAFGQTSFDGHSAQLPVFGQVSFAGHSVQVGHSGAAAFLGVPQQPTITTAAKTIAANEKIFFIVVKILRFITWKNFRYSVLLVTKLGSQSLKSKFSRKKMHRSGYFIVIIR